jgi:hypothetical protein
VKKLKETYHITCPLDDGDWFGSHTCIGYMNENYPRCGKINTNTFEGECYLTPDGIIDKKLKRICFSKII